METTDKHEDAYINDLNELILECKEEINDLAYKSGLLDKNLDAEINRRIGKVEVAIRNVNTSSIYKKSVIERLEKFRYYLEGQLSNSGKGSANKAKFKGFQITIPVVKNKKAFLLNLFRYLSKKGKIDKEDKDIFLAYFQEQWDGTSKIRWTGKPREFAAFHSLMFNPIDDPDNSLLNNSQIISYGKRVKGLLLATFVIQNNTKLTSQEIWDSNKQPKNSPFYRDLLAEIEGVLG